MVEKMGLYKEFWNNALGRDEGKKDFLEEYPPMPPAAPHQYSTSDFGLFFDMKTENFPRFMKQSNLIKSNIDGKNSSSWTFVWFLI